MTERRFRNRQADLTVYVVYQVDTRFTIDCSRRFVRGPDSDIHLRPKSFRVLEVLLENRDRALSKDELLATVWEGMAVTDDVLVTSITELRRAFGDDSRAPSFIKTIHGTGYRWIAAVTEKTEHTSAGMIAGAAGKSARPTMVAAGLVVLASAAVLSLRTSHGVTEHIKEVAWWRFNETSGEGLMDSSGHGNSGRIASGAKRVAGKMGGALQFDGVGDGASGTAGSLLPVGSAPRTITAWVKTDSTNGDFTNVFHYGVDGAQSPGAGFAMVVTPDGLLRAGSDFRTGFVSGRSRIDDGVWHMLAAVYEGGRSNMEHLYVDGLEDGSGTLKAAPATENGGTWTIGRFLGGGTRFRGTLDDVRVFDRAVESAEVHAFFRCSSGVVDVSSGEAGYYYLPIAGAVPRFTGGEIANSGNDIGGVQLARRDGTCSAASLDGAGLPQDVYLAADLKTPLGPKGQRTEAGLYFRSRKAHVGDGIMGGTSAGYWVRMAAGGQVSVVCLNPGRVVAFTNVPDLAPDAFHRLEVTATGEVL